MRLVRKKFTSRKYDLCRVGVGGIVPCPRSEVPSRQEIIIFEIIYSDTGWKTE